MSWHAPPPASPNPPAPDGGVARRRRARGPRAHALRPLARGLTRRWYNYMVVPVQIAPPDLDRVFDALADRTRRDIVRRAISAEEGVLELASHYPMTFSAVQKHVAVLERAGLITKQRIGRRKVVRTNLEALLVARRLLDRYEELWRARIGRMDALIAETAGAIDTVATKESRR